MKSVVITFSLKSISLGKDFSGRETALSIHCFVVLVWYFDNSCSERMLPKEKVEEDEEEQEGEGEEEKDVRRRNK